MTATGSVAMLEVSHSGQVEVEIELSRRQNRAAESMWMSNFMIIKDAAILCVSPHRKIHTAEISNLHLTTYNRRQRNPQFGRSNMYHHWMRQRLCCAGCLFHRIVKTMIDFIKEWCPI